ncbi:hypothetical protein A1O3_06859 [Capronia epimyces CBS 606.96]|uniref:Cytochrome P450 oxidoreductase n=1 Tax=Capronia epimyces CBS 606.96 TaxID=1182542 RepID=W9XR69_9EURO|nr:uncharacterized protein A1O3_06859 [Capronia epimyces CBS 606.96]EXJ83042.1 hypothetical protein A1O3_06859 [Capronia epimyces CBS 606.96]
MSLNFIPGSPVVVAAIVIAIFSGLYRLLQVGRRDPRMPPGPPTLPVLGNIHQIPRTGLFKQFREWAKQYGSVYSLKMGPANVIVLCDRRAVHDLLDKKSKIYSDRPESYVGDLLSHGDHIVVASATAEWREKRKVVAHNFSPKMLDEKHFKVQEAEATVLMENLLDDPEDFVKLVRRYTASAASCIVFGQRADKYEDFWGHTVYEVMEHFSSVMEPGSSPPVEIFPVLKWIPESMALWKRRAMDARRSMDAAWGEARARVEARRAKGIQRDCIIDHLLDEYNEKGWPFSQHAFNNLMGELVEGAADTTASQICTLIMAFALHPEVQVKARKEIDAVCGTDRSPRWTDFAEIPYVNAIVKEGMRWRPTSPTAIPHLLKQDDWYNGMLFPKGSIIYLASWAIHHDENIYKGEDDFNPDRYIGYTRLANDYAGSPDWEHRDHFGYGAGRRICPGIHLAERNMWRIAAKLLWAFEFSQAIDPQTQQPIPIDTHAYTPGTAQFPLPFQVQIKPRSQEHIQRIISEKNNALDFLTLYR